MSTPASIANHPFHPMLVVFPIGLWVFSLVADVVYLAGGPPEWGAAAFYTMGGGILGAALAAVPGLIDLVSLPASRAQKIGLVHMGLNVLALVLFAVNFGMRWPAEAPTAVPVTLSVVGVITLIISGWLGGEMVYVHGVAVTQGANVFGAPSTGRHGDTTGPATGREAA